MKRGEYNRLNPSHYDFGASLRKECGISSFNRLVRQYKYSAKRRGLTFFLTDEDVRSITSSCCEYCGIVPKQIMCNKEANGSYIYNGIDRKDATIGYELYNCVPCCKQCNKAKSNMTWDEWKDFISRLVSYNE